MNLEHRTAVGPPTCLVEAKPLPPARRNNIRGKAKRAHQAASQPRTFPAADIASSRRATSSKHATKRGICARETEVTARKSAGVVRKSRPWVPSSIPSTHTHQAAWPARDPSAESGSTAAAARAA